MSLPTGAPTVAGGFTEIESATIAGVTALSVQSNGATVFAETVVESLLGNGDATSTVIILSTPTTLVFTFAEDASLISQSVVQTTTLGSVGGPMVYGDDTVCTGTRGGEVSCVLVQTESLGDGQTLASTLTYSATRVPLFTIKSGGGRVVFSIAMIFLSTSFACFVLHCL